MSLTLGEKLRQAREARGISISEVADQTRISALYLNCIENDDYRTLPGGIFNKGFVKSFAKTVGVDEQEALADYSQLIAGQGVPVDDEPKTYRPEVLTDGRSSFSMLPTIILAAIILGLMTFGILALVNYLQKAPAQPTANVNSNTNANAAPNANVSNVPTMTATTPVSDLKVEFTATGGDIYLLSVSDDKPSNILLKSGNSSTFEPKEKLKLSFARERIRYAQLVLDGKQIALPNAPAKGNVIIEINKDNAGQIKESGQISLVAAAAPKR